MNGVNRFDTLFKGITFDYIPLQISTIYAGKDTLMTYELFLYQYKELEKPDLSGLKYVLHNIEMPLLPILEDMQRYRSKHKSINVKRTIQQIFC